MKERKEGWRKGRSEGMKEERKANTHTHTHTKFVHKETKTGQFYDTFSSFFSLYFPTEWYVQVSILRKDI